MRSQPAEDLAVDVPHTSLSETALQRLIEEFVTRSGTDYGAEEKALDQKIVDVRHQLERGKAKVIFDPATGTANIVLAKPA